MELKNFEPKTQEDIKIALFIEGFTIENQNDLYRDKDSFKEQYHFEVANGLQ